MVSCWISLWFSAHEIHCFGREKCLLLLPTNFFGNCFVSQIHKFDSVIYALENENMLEALKMEVRFR